MTVRQPATHDTTTRPLPARIHLRTALSFPWGPALLACSPPTAPPTPADFNAPRYVPSLWDPDPTATAQLGGVLAAVAVVKDGPPLPLCLSPPPPPPLADPNPRQPRTRPWCLRPPSFRVDTTRTDPSPVSETHGFPVYHDVLLISRPVLSPSACRAQKQKTETETAPPAADPEPEPEPDVTARPDRRQAPARPVVNNIFSSRSGVQTDRRADRIPPGRIRNTMAVASSSSSSTTAADRDVEAQRQEAPIAPKTSHWSVLLDQAGVDDAVLNHKYPGNGTVESPYLVDFLPSDPRNPVTFSKTFKWAITLIAAMSTLAVSFASSAYSGGVFEIMMDFGASTEVVILGVSMFVLGFAIGPLIWAPLSEMYGRQHLFFFTYMALTAFNAGAAGAPSMAALIVLRFFAGAFGSSPLTNAGGVIADMFSANERGIATSIFAMAPFLGPALGPIAGGFLGEAEGWRWVEGLTAIFTGVLWIINSLVYPETYAPVLLRKRAIALSEKTGKVYISKLDEGKPKKSVGSQMKVAMSRPWILLFREPIVLLTAIYMAIIYGTLYLCFAAFPIVFQQGRAGSPVSAVWPSSRAAKKAGGMAPPEARLPPALVGSILLPVGLFWFAWTNGNSVHWVVPIIGSGFFAAGIVLVFLSLMNYLVDSYVIFAASVLAANSVLRSLFGAIFPLFTTYMYQDLGNHWASSIPAFLALACVPFPFLFYKYGARIRMKCKFAAEAAHVLEMMRTKHTQITEEEAVHEADDKERERRESTALEKQATNAQQASS
ncbi:hypothetical protein ACCO45_001479 [Purpureocillium lilacinum]|uniref:Uncharacterized protein n=1 Tax=Purpureocillium lilacinum TaxID=33203 RepID=A0ACC4E9X3_PURLI